MTMPNQEGDLLESRPGQTPGPSLTDLEENLLALRRIVVAALVALIFLAYGVNFFMWRQSTLAVRQLAEARKLVDDYREIKAPFIKNFVNKLQVYANTHLDFQPILSRYTEPASVKPVVNPTNSPPPPRAK